MNSKRQHILHWAEQGYISPDDVDTALSLSRANPDNQQWFQFIKNLFLWLGVISLAAGTLFFFAFNWDEMSNLVKFALNANLSGGQYPDLYQAQTVHPTKHRHRFPYGNADRRPACVKWADLPNRS